MAPEPFASALAASAQLARQAVDDRAIVEQAYEATADSLQVRLMECKKGVVEASRYLPILRSLWTLEPKVFVIGGIAEDAFLYGTMTRDHYDIDMCLLRQDLPIRIEQLGRLGFTDIVVKHEAGGVPMVYEGHNNDLHVELGPIDRSESGELSFIAPGLDGPVRVVLPEDTFHAPPTVIDGTPIQTASPRMLYGLRAGLQAAGGFTPLDERGIATQKLLREKLLADLTEAELQPRVERVSSVERS